MEQERTTVTFNDNFAYDLEFGRIREQRLSEILLNKKIEVKTERGKWVDTGNLAIEIECRGKPSGLAATEAEYWMHILEVNGKEFCSLLFPVHALKTLLKGIKNPNIVNGGDDNAARLVLVPVGDIFKIAKSLK
tara:strand:- start:2151 stop:2552 length:402 start_codon:yes stop_codon:yes gene_type:complete